MARAQIRGSGLLLAGQAFAAVVNLATQILIVRYLSKSDYGVFAYVLSVVTFAEAFAAFGFHRAITRLMPIYEERGERARAAGALVLAAVTVVFVGLALILLAVGFRGFLAGGVEGGDATPILLIMIPLAPLAAMGTVLEGVFAVFHMPRAILVRRHVLGPLLRLAVVGLLALTASGVTFLAWGYVAAGLFGLAVFGPLLRPALREEGLASYLRPKRLVFPFREAFRYAATLLSTDLAAAGLVTSGPILVGLLADSTEVASLRAVLPIVGTMAYVLSSFARLFWPLASRLYSRSDAGELNRLYWQTTAWTTVLAYPVFAASVVLAQPLTVLLFGDRYASSAAVLAVLAFGHYAHTASGHNGELLGVFGRIRFIVLTNVFTVVMAIGLMLLLIPGYGALGAAIATSATYVTLSGVRQIALSRMTTVRGFDPRYASVWAVALVTTAISFAAKVVLDLPVPVTIALVAGSFVSIFLFSQSKLQVVESFPELKRLPLLGPLLRWLG